MAVPWAAKKILLSQATAQSVLEVRALKVSIQQRRQEAFPKDLRSWVADRASEGDARAAAQLRGWRYADQRNQRRLDARLEASALHIGPSSDSESEADWSQLAQQRLASQQREQMLAKQIATTRIWTIDRRTGDVSYMLNGRVSVIDRGRVVTVLSQDEVAIVFGLEMAIQKYGSRIACTGTGEWKRMVTKTAVQHGIFVQFTNPEMQTTHGLEQRNANQLQLQAARLHSIETRLRTEEAQDLIFTNEADVRQLLFISPAGCSGTSIGRASEAVSTPGTEVKRRRHSDHRPSRVSHGPAVFQGIDSRGEATRDHRSGCASPPDGASADAQ